MNNRDPIARFEAQLQEFGVADQAQIEAVREAVRQEIADGIEFAKQSPSPDISDLADYVYTEQA